MFEGIYFANPNYLWLLLLLPVVIAWHIFTWKKSQASLKISSLAGFGKQSSLLTKLRHILFVFRILASLAVGRQQLGPGLPLFIEHGRGQVDEDQALVLFTQ